MPNLITHFELALRTLEALDDSSLDANRESFLLGCTTPDIRAQTKWKRSRTHFCSLEVGSVGVGTAGLFEENDHLYDATRKDAVARAFIAGYISHLTTDEAWIIGIYRPYFADRERFPNPKEANIWDRALQLDLDRSAWSYIDNVDRIAEQLLQYDMAVDVGFIEPEILNQWRVWVADFVRRPFNWDRLHFLAQRMYQEDEEAWMISKSFLEAIPANLKKVYSKVTQNKVSEFRDQAVGESVRLIKEHLNGT